MHPPGRRLLAMVAVLAARHDPAAREVGTAAAIFTVSIVFRTIDKMLCAAFPIGTHFLWHACNAIVLYLLFAALIRGTASQCRATVHTSSRSS